MSELPKSAKKRKVLNLKLPPEIRRDHIDRERARFMVWAEDGDAPKRIYDDPYLACAHARSLCKQTGRAFHVFRSWRVMEEY